MNCFPVKRQRTRKMSRPQRRLKQADSYQEVEQIVEQKVSAIDYSSQQTHILSENICTDNDISPSSAIAGNNMDEDRPSQTREDGEDRPSQAREDGEDLTIKKEIVNGFIVDQWYDLGPSLHKDGHSPEPLSSTDFEKMEVKESPERNDDVSQLQTDFHVRKTRTSGEQRQICSTDEEKYSTKDSHMIEPGHVDPTTEKVVQSVPEILEQQKGAKTVLDFVNTMEIPPLSFPHQFFGHPLSNNFSLPTDPYPLAQFLHGTASSNCRQDGGISYSSLSFPSNLNQAGTFQTSGLVFVPSHPYYIQQMSFLSMLPAINYSTLQPDDLSFVSSRKVRDEMVSSLKIHNQATCAINMATSNTKTSLVEDNQPRHSFGQNSSRGRLSASQQISRVKPKSCSDFVDPTSIKFGLDDTDDDLSRLNEGSDCSDKEWQPNKRDWKKGGWMDTGGGDVLIHKEGIIESDNSENKTRVRCRRHSSKKPAKCDECGKVFQGIYYLRRHQMSHSDIRPYQCETCHKSFKQKAHLIGHQRIHGRDLQLTLTEEKNPSPKVCPQLGLKCPGRPKKTYTDKDLACKECGKTFKTVYRLRRHELSHTDVRPFPCRICGKSFKQTGHRNEHEANHEKTKKRFLCNTCGVVFRSRSSFNNHLRSHGKERLRLQMARPGDLENDSKLETNEVFHTGYDCPYCPEKFATAQALNSHLETHVEEQQRRHVQPYSCDVCKRAFTYRHNLMKHKLIHKAPDKFAQFYKEKVEAHVASGKPSFKCAMCSKVFIRKETLAKHFKIHSGNKPFKCAICSRDFTQNIHLKVHMRKHTGSRPFQCRECNKSFIDSTALAKHIEYEACNTDNSLYNCKICDKLHYYLGSLKQHIRKKHGIEEPEVETYILKSARPTKRRASNDGEKHSCKVCSSVFSEKCNLVRHIRRKHAALVELLHKELRDKNRQSFGEETVKKKDTAEDSGMHKDMGNDKLDYDSNGSSAFLSESSKWSLAKTSSSEVFTSKTNPTEGTLGNPTAERSPSEEGLPSGSDDAREHPVDVRAGLPWTDITKTAERCEHLPEKTRPRARGFVYNSSFISSDKANRNVSKWTEDNIADEFLEGFHETGFSFHNRVFTRDSGEGSCLCRHGCCSDITADGSKVSDTGCCQDRKSGVDANKEGTDEDTHSTTNINFLYNIGLIVSSEAKCSRNSPVHETTKTRGCHWGSDLIMSPRDASTGCSSLNAGHLNKGQLLDHVCYTPESVDYLDENFVARSNALSPNGVSDMSKTCNDQMRPDLRNNLFEDPRIKSERSGRYEVPPGDTAANIGIYGQANSRESQKESAKSIKVSHNGEKRQQTLTNDAQVNIQVTGSRVHAEVGNEQDKLFHGSVCRMEISPSSDSCIQDKVRNQSALSQAENVGGYAFNLKSAKIARQFLPTDIVHQKPDKGDNSKNIIVENNICSYTARAPQQDPFIVHEEQEQSICCKTPSIATKQSTTALSVSDTVSHADGNQSLTLPFDRKPFNKGPNRCPGLFTPIRNDASLLVSERLDRSVCKQMNPSLTTISGNSQPNTVKPQSIPVSNPGLVSLPSQHPSLDQSQTDYLHEPDMVDGGAVKLESGKDLVVCTQEVEDSHSHKVTSSNGAQTRNAAFQVSLPDSTRNEYEACPTESHLKYLGLLACRDAQEIRNKAVSLEHLYVTYKPWLEDLVHRSRPRRTRSNIKVNSSLKRSEEAATDTDSTAAQDQEKCSSSSDSTDNLKQTRKTLFQDGCNDSTVATDDDSSQTHNESIVFRKRRRCLSKGDMRAEEKFEDDEKIQEQSANPLKSCTANESYEKTNYHSPETSSSELASSTTNSQTRASTSLLTAPSIGTIPAVDALPASTATSLLSPPSTPDSTVRGRQLFTCQVCLKYFTARHQLKRHEMTHTDYRPYNCDKCGRAFRQKVHLSDHMKRHQGQRPFICAGCGKRFVLKNEMNQHMKNHCRGAVDVQKNTAVVENALTIPLIKLKHSTGDGDAATLPSLDSQEIMLLLGHAYNSSEIISKGAVTLRVIRSGDRLATDRFNSDRPESQQTPMMATRSIKADSMATSSQSEDLIVSNGNQQPGNLDRQPRSDTLQGREDLTRDDKRQRGEDLTRDDTLQRGQDLTRDDTLKGRQDLTCDDKLQGRQDLTCDDKLQGRQDLTCDDKLQGRQDLTCDDKLQGRQDLTCDDKLQGRQDLTCDDKLQGRQDLTRHGTLQRGQDLTRHGTLQRGQDLTCDDTLQGSQQTDELIKV